MDAGFTGTRQGATVAQIRTVEDLWIQRGITRVHFGLCTGSDEDLQAHAIAMGIRPIGHPPENEKLLSKRALAQIAPADLWAPKDYLERDRDIVKAGRELYATPYEDVEPTATRGGGTWYTIRYARSRLKPVIIVWPDGTSNTERWEL
jgi:hypothetical protein